MKYPEFLHSAKRHNHACRILKEKLDSYAEEDQSSDNFKYLVVSLYYLSGYIIECSLKFKIFECYNFDDALEIDETECRSQKIKYRTHSFDNLQNLLNSKISDISYESENPHITALLESWNPEVRYKRIELQHDHEHKKIVAFYTHANEFLKKM